MKVFIDANVFIIGFTQPNTNSKIIVHALKTHIMIAVVSELAAREVRHFLLKNYGDQMAYTAIKFIEDTCTIIPAEIALLEMRKWKNKIKEKDLENLAVAKMEKVDYLVSFDRDYKNFKEHITPKEFVKLLKLKPFETEY